ncbi:MAG: hypothetical protein M0025_05525 [Elusimicrobia bacterium]|nr:hypothetical protein [Elusimicrobiota bacterium]
MGKGHLYILPGCLLLFACASPQRAKPAHTPVHMEQKKVLTPEQSRLVDQLYYKAVGAYSRNDMPAAVSFLGELFRIAPEYPPALELRKKIRLASGI